VEIIAISVITHPVLPSNVGVDDAYSVSPDYTHRSSRFSGEVNWMEIDMEQAAEESGHLITEEEHYRVAMGV
jgi:arylsulfatase